MDWVGTAVRSGAPSGQSASAKLSTDATDYPHALAMVASGVCLADGVAERGSDESFANSPAAPAVRCFFHLDGRYLLNLPAHGRHLAASRGTTRGAAAAQRCSGPARPGAGARPRHGSQVSSCQAARAAPRSCMRSKRRTCVGRPRHPRGPGHKRGGENLVRVDPNRRVRRQLVGFGKVHRHFNGKISGWGVRRDTFAGCR